MQAAGLSDESQQKVLGALDGNRSITGTVILVTTHEKETSVAISSGTPAYESLTASFPPGSPEMLAELKRAQNEDRSVTVVVNSTDGTEKLISVLVYAGQADPASNRRR